MRALLFNYGRQSDSRVSDVEEIKSHPTWMNVGRAKFLFYDDSYQSSPPSYLVTVPRLLGLLKALGGQRLVLRGIRFLRPGVG